MDLEQTSQLLAKAALVDNRKVTPEVILAWAEPLRHVPLDAALWALNWHRARSTDWVQPGHITAGAREYRKWFAQQQQKQRAIAAAPPRVEPPPAWVREWLDGLKAKDKAVLDG
jgi:hypothetical protein